MTPSALLSVHDVTPRNHPRVRRILELLSGAGAPPATLLIVPGREWSDDHLRRLREWEDTGHRLAGHGWSHAAPSPATLRHRLHAALISRDRAEHLSRSRDEARAIVRRCHTWFRRNGLAAPELYVPPAWALGALTRNDLEELPFRWYETLTGFLDAATGRRLRLPLVGFEADTAFRAFALRATNALNLGLARALDRAVRIAIHPDDLELRLAGRLRRAIQRPWRWVESVDELVGGEKSRPPS